MTKKIRFPLEMENGAEVRNVEELREYFSITRVLSYLENGKLVTWLQDRYEDKLVEEVEQLDGKDQELPGKLCEIFGVPYQEKTMETLETEMERNRRIERLKEYTGEKRFLDEVDVVAFEQDELYDLLDEGRSTIYLCGERFLIPLSKKGMTYIGINKPTVVIDSKEVVDWKEAGITLEGVRFDEKYQALLEAKKKEEAACQYDTDYDRLWTEMVASNADDFQREGFYVNGGNRYVGHPYEDESNIYFVSDSSLKSIIYDKHTKKASIYAIEKAGYNFPVGFGWYKMEIWPETSWIGVGSAGIVFVKDESIYICDYKGTDAVQVYKNSGGEISSVWVWNDRAYFSIRHSQGLHRFEGEFRALNLKDGTCERILDKIFAVAYQGKFVYLLSKKNYGATNADIFQLELESSKYTKVKTISMNNYPDKVYVKNYFLTVSHFREEELRVAEIDDRFGAVSEEEYRKAGFGERVQRLDTYKDTEFQLEFVEASSWGFNNIEGSLFGREKGRYIKLSDTCRGYDREGDIVFFIDDDRNILKKYHIKTKETQSIELKIETFAVKEGKIYYKVLEATWEDKYGRTIYIADYEGNSLGTVPYTFDAEVYWIFKHGDYVFAVSDSIEMNVAYMGTDGKWRPLLDKVRSYCLEKDYIFYVRYDIEDNEQSYHRYYCMRLSDRTERLLYQKKVSYMGDFLYPDKKSLRYEKGKIYCTIPSKYQSKDDTEVTSFDLDFEP